MPSAAAPLLEPQSHDLQVPFGREEGPLPEGSAILTRPCRAVRRALGLLGTPSRAQHLRRIPFAARRVRERLRLPWRGRGGISLRKKLQGARAVISSSAGGTVADAPEIVERVPTALAAMLPTWPRAGCRRRGASHPSCASWRSSSRRPSGLLRAPSTVPPSMFTVGLKSPLFAAFSCRSASQLP